MNATQRPDILLATINARYIHSAFGLRYLLANLGPLAPRTKLLEWNIQQPTHDCIADILRLRPKILGLGVYIWNVEKTTQLVAALKRLMPDVYIILGGPEVSFTLDDLTLAKDADLIIQGEADLLFPQVCQQILDGSPPTEKVCKAPLPAIEEIALPYHLYLDEDVANRVIYVEVSRGCPFRCEFCLSSLPLPVRQFDIDAFLASMEQLLQRGVRQFKFVDRTFNLNLKTSQQILDFFYERMQPGLFLHFEMIPDRFPEALRESVKRFPPGTLQFEVGIQTFNEDVAARISRRQKNQQIEDNLLFLRHQTGIHVHADLIAGLPGEDIASFGAGFDRLLALGPQEIQLGILKCLRGTPISRHDQEWSMVYSPDPPYEILQTGCIDFFAMQQLQRLTRFWDKYGNSGNFAESLPLLWAPASAGTPTFSDQQVLPAGVDPDSPFGRFWCYCDWLYQQVERTHGLSLQRLMESLFLYMTDVTGLHEPSIVAAALWQDYQCVPRPNIPAFLKPFVLSGNANPSRAHASSNENAGPSRQARHLAALDTPSNT